MSYFAAVTACSPVMMIAKYGTIGIPITNLVLAVVLVIKPNTLQYVREHPTGEGVNQAGDFFL